ncbi:MAG: hypothetical protein ACOWWR_05670 [Eubacteriales bacterium]
MDNLNELENSVLMDRLTNLKDELEDLEMEKNMVLGQTGLHISSKKVMQQAREYEAEILKVKEFIAELTEEIKNRGL